MLCQITPIHTVARPLAQITELKGSRSNHEGYLTRLQPANQTNWIYNKNHTHACKENETGDTVKRGARTHTANLTSSGYVSLSRAPPEADRPHSAAATLDQQHHQHSLTCGRKIKNNVLKQGNGSKRKQLKQNKAKEWLKQKLKLNKTKQQKQNSSGSAHLKIQRATFSTFTRDQ